MRYLLPAALLTAALALAACGHDDNHAHDHGNAPSRLELNDGKKWEADKPTREAVAGMKLALAATENNRALGEKLRGQYQALLQGCTMTGAAHNQLHHWLNLLLPAVDQLAEETDVAKSDAARQEVRRLLDEYDKYFA